MSINLFDDDTGINQWRTLAGCLQRPEQPLTALALIERVKGIRAFSVF